MAQNLSGDIGSSSDAPATTDGGTFSLISLFKRLLQRLNSGNVIGAVEQSGSWAVDQGAAGAEAWPVNIQGGTIEVGNLQQLANIADVNETVDLVSGPYTRNVAYTNDSTLKILRLTFATAEPRTITISSTLGGITNTIDTDVLDTTVGPVDYEFGEEGEIEEGTTITISVTGTTNPCEMKVFLLSQLGTSALGGNPVLGEGDANIGYIGFSDTQLLDAFGRLRTSTPEGLFSVKQIYNNIDLFYGNFGAGVAEYIPNKSAVVLRIPAGVVGEHTQASHYHVAYQAGKSQFEQITAVLGAKTPGVIRRFGMRNFFGERIFIEQNGDDNTVYTVIESYVGGVLQRRAVDRINWLDTLLGVGGANNKSGEFTDFTKNELLNIDWQWLSAGRLRFGLSFNGQPTTIDTRKHGNILDVPFIRCPDMQVFWSIETTQPLLDDAEMLAICAAVSSEGGAEPSGIHFSASSGTTPKTVGVNFTPVLAIRSAALYKGEPNVIASRLRDLKVHATQPIEYRLVYFPTTTIGDSWTAVGGHSSMEYSRNLTGYTGGQIIDRDYILSAGAAAKTSESAVSINAQKEIICRKADNSAGIVMLLEARRTGAVDSDVFAVMRWLEDLG